MKAGLMKQEANPTMKRWERSKQNYNPKIFKQKHPIEKEAKTCSKRSTYWSKTIKIITILIETKEVDNSFQDGGKLTFLYVANIHKRMVRAKKTQPQSSRKRPLPKNKFSFFSHKR